MTLLITSLTPHGIIMGSDSVLSIVESGRRGLLITPHPGFQKIYPIESINCAISCWGEGWTDVTSFDTNQFWISTFIEENEGEYTNIHEFAVLLANTINDRRDNPLTIPNNMNQLHHWRYGTVGAHLTGYIDTDGGLFPALYHIHNGISERFNDINPSIVNPNFDLPPALVQELFSRGVWPLHRNGDFSMYATLDAMINGLFDNLRRVILPTGDMFEIPSDRGFGTILSAYVHYIAFWIKIVRDIFRLSTLPNTVGGAVQICTITEGGNIRFIPVEDPIELLNYRLAVGEISSDQYSRIMEILRPEQS